MSGWSRAEAMLTVRITGLGGGPRDDSAALPWVRTFFVLLLFLICQNRECRRASVCVCVCVCVCVLTRSSPPPGSKRTDITYRGEWAGKPSLQAFGCKIHKTTEQQSEGRVKKKVFLFFLLNAASC